MTIDNAWEGTLGPYNSAAQNLYINVVNVHACSLIARSAVVEPLSSQCMYMQRSLRKASVSASTLRSRPCSDSASKGRPCSDSASKGRPCRQLTLMHCVL